MSELTDLEISLKVDGVCFEAETNDRGQLVSIVIFGDDYEFFDEIDDFLEKLKNYSQLESISITDEFYIRDISFLKGFEKLKYLNLYDCQCDFEDISVLSGLESLETVKFGDTRITQLDSIQDLARLKCICIASSMITDISPIAKLTALEELRLSSSSIFNINALKHCKKLRYLQLCTNKIEDISPIEGLAELVELQINFNNISDITPIAFLRELAYLQIANNQVSNGTALQNLPVLKNLSIHNNKLYDVSFLSKMDSLQYLSLANNPIDSQLHAISALKNLEQLDLSDISNIKNKIKSLPSSLKWLTVTNCDLEDVSIFLTLDALVYLDVSFNRIKDIDGLIVLENLKVLNLKNNWLERESIMMINRHLTYINIEENPFYDAIQHIVVPESHSLSSQKLRTQVLELNKEWWRKIQFPADRYYIGNKLDMGLVFDYLINLKQSNSHFFYILSYEVEIYIRETYGEDTVIKYIQALKNLDFTVIKNDIVLREQKLESIYPKPKIVFDFDKVLLIIVLIIVAVIGCFFVIAVLF